MRHIVVVAGPDTSSEAHHPGTDVCTLPFSAYLTWSKLTNNEVVCPVAGCSTILSSPYAQIGPFPLPALGMAAYGSVAALSLMASLQEKQARMTKRLDSLATSQRAILAGAASGCGL